MAQMMKGEATMIIDKTEQTEYLTGELSKLLDERDAYREVLRWIVGPNSAVLSSPKAAVLVAEQSLNKYAR